MRSEERWNKLSGIPILIKIKRMGARRMDKEHDGCEGCMYQKLKADQYPCLCCSGGHDKPNGYADMYSPMASDVVNRPAHYTQGIECIDEMLAIFGRNEVMSFCKLNVWKYRKRALYKNGQEDMDKADWYMNKYIELKMGDKK